MDFEIAPVSIVVGVSRIFLLPVGTGWLRRRMAGIKRMRVFAAGVRGPRLKRVLKKADLSP